MVTERRTARRADFVPIEAKLRADLRHDGLVLRGDLIDLLLDNAGTPVVLLTGSPGAGKTALLTQWAAEDPRPFAWVVVDAADNDVAVLVIYLTLALFRAAAVDDEVLAQFTGLTGHPDASLLIERFTTMLCSQPPLVLVLDGAHALSSLPSLALVERLAERLPVGSQLVLSGRSAPSLDWGSLRARHRLVEIDDAQLRLSRSEARSLVEAEGLQLSDRELTALLKRTEGWAAGTYLAAAALRSADPAAAPLDDAVSDYLRDEVLRSLAPADQTFLVRTSVLDQLSGPLCDAVLGSHGSSDILRRLGEANVLLTRLDDSGRCYRVNPVFHLLLRQELVRREPALPKALHARASHWLADNGDAEGAIEHALAAGDVPRLARLVWDSVPDCLDRGRVDQLDQWINRMDTRHVMAQAKLALAAAWRALMRGQRAEHWIAAAERGHYDARRKGEATAVAGGAALLRAAIARNGFTQMGADARLAVELDDRDVRWVLTADGIDAVSAYLRGGVHEAADRLQELAASALPLNAHHMSALSLAELALLALEHDDWPTTTAYSNRAAVVARTHHLEDYATLVMVHGLAAATRAHGGGKDDANLLARRCLVRLAAAPHVPTWVGVQCRQALARAYLELGDAAAARTVLSEAQSMLAGVPDAAFVRQSLARLWNRLETFPVDPEPGASTLTTAELRVVQLLPTNLSFEAIGRRLFISRNTVKTEAVSAYRKLGARSRSEAVERAQGMGLISGDPGA